MTFIRNLILLCCGFYSSLGFASDGEWSGNGPLGGSIFELVFHPSSNQIAYASTQGGIYKTQDAGATWRRTSDGIIATSVYPLPLIMDREAPNVLYTFDSSLRIYRSTDAAESWQILNDNLDDGFLFSAISDVAGEVRSIFIGGVSQAPTGAPQLFKSSDGGSRFIRVGTGLPNDARIALIKVDPLDAAVVYVGIYGNGATNQASLFRSVDGGLNFSPVLNLFGALGYQPDVQDLSFIPGTGNIATGSLFAVIDFNIYHSNDGGNNWTGPHGPASVITAHPTDPLKAYFGRSDGAFVWLAPNPSPSFSPYSEGLSPNASYLSIPGGTPIHAAVSRLVTQPGYPAVGTALYASTDGSGVFKREQGAPTWSPTATSPTGVSVRTLQIHPHPSLNTITGSNVLFAGHSGFAVSSPGLYFSSNQALTWSPLNLGLRANELQTLQVDRTTLNANVSNVVWYAGGSSADVDPTFDGAGIFRSTNNGANWTSMDGNLPQDATAHANIGLIRNLTLDPRSCASPPVVGPCTTGGLQRLYGLAEGLAEAATFRGTVNGFNFTHRVVRTDDFGTTWEALDDIPSELTQSFTNDLISQRITPSAMAIDPNNSNVIYLGTEAIYDDFNTSDAVVPDDLTSGVFKSIDAGNTWGILDNNGLPTKAGFTSTQLDVVDLLIDPTNSNVIWVALTDLRSTGFSTIYRSADAGLSWTAHDNGINGSIELRDLAMDPQNPNVLYAAAAGYEANPGAIYRGVWDPGSNSIVWLSISIGLPSESAYSVAVDPFNPDVLHAGTDIGVLSIRRQPDQDNDGIPDAIENLAPDVPGGLVGLGDGNGDGFMDAAQRDVGSIGVVKRFPSGTTTIPVTTDLVGGAGVSACVSGTAQAVDVQVRDPNALGLDPAAGNDVFYNHRVGINEFELLGCSAATIRLRYHGANFNANYWSFRVFAPALAGDENDMGWFDFSSHATLISSDTWQINLTAGDFGSYRPELDAIRFVGGPACYDPRLFADGMEDTPVNLAVCN